MLWSCCWIPWNGPGPARSRLGGVKVFLYIGGPILNVQPPILTVPLVRPSFMECNKSRFPIQPLPLNFPNPSCLAGGSVSGLRLFAGRLGDLKWASGLLAIGIIRFVFVSVYCATSCVTGFCRSFLKGFVEHFVILFTCGHYTAAICAPKALCWRPK